MHIRSTTLLRSFCPARTGKIELKQFKGCMEEVLRYKLPMLLVLALSFGSAPAFAQTDASGRVGDPRAVCEAASCSTICIDSCPPEPNLGQRTRVCASSGEVTSLGMISSTNKFGARICSQMYGDNSAAGVETVQEAGTKAEDASPNWEAVADRLNAQVAELLEKQCLDEALPLARRAVDVTLKNRGPEHPDNIATINNLAWILQSQGRYGEARPLFEQSLGIAEKSLGQFHQTTVICRNNLAGLLSLQGDLENARKEYARALAASEKELGPNALPLAGILSNLGGLLGMEGNSEAAISMYRRAFAIMESHPESSPADMAQALNNAAAELVDCGDTAQALNYLERALQLRQGALGAEHLDVGETLNNIAVLEKALGHLDKSSALLERAREIYERKEGPEHLDQVSLLNNLGDLRWQQGKEDAAKDCYLRAATIVDRYFERILPTLSYAEQQAVLGSRVPAETSRLLSSACRDSKTLPKAYDLLFRWKGQLVQAMARESAARLVGDRRLDQKMVQLREVRAKLAGWYQEFFQVGPSVWKSTNDRLTAEKEELERDLSREFLSRGIGSGAVLLDLDTFRKQLRVGEAVVDIYLYDALDSRMRSGWRYGAIIVTASGTSPGCTFVDIGDADVIEHLLSAWRDDVSSGGCAEGSWRDLSASLSILVKSVPPATTRVLICPDAELSRMPWNLLAEYGDSDSDIHISQVDSCRELFALRCCADKRSDRAAVPAVLVAGGIDFNAGVKMAAGAAVSNKQPLFRLELLPGSLIEADDVAALAEKEHFRVLRLSGAGATKAAIVATLPAVEFAHLSTHGFFLDESSLGDARRYLPGSLSRGIALQSRLPEGALWQQRNPLVESGLAVSGANQNCLESGEKSGYLTAEELVGLNLQRCRLLTLSACETGRGKAVTGQGVLGLRSSIMAAGAHSILMSLWKVPDAATSRLMQYFYEELWTKKTAAVEALRRAQARLRKDPSMARPMSWAAWVLVGDCW